MKDIAVLINFYKEDLSENEILSYKRCLKVLGSYDLYLLGPEGVKLDIYEKYAPGIKKHLVKEELFAGLKNYSKYMLSEQFYYDFKDYKRILIYQFDCWVFENELEYWASTDYDFIGAPLFEKWGKNTNFKFYGVGNGGFSLRNPQNFYYVARNWERLLSYQGIWKSQFIHKGKQKVKLTISKLLSQLTFYSYHTPLNTIFDQLDDCIWGIFLSKENNLLKTPKPEEALKFSMEVHPAFLYKKNNNRLPFGCHAWEKYDKEFWLQFIPANEKQIKV